MDIVQLCRQIVDCVLERIVLIQNWFLKKSFM